MSPPPLPLSTTDQRGRLWGFLLALCVTLGTALVAAIGAYSIRRVIHQGLLDSAAAQTVIRVAKLHAVAERMGGHARGYLLTPDPGHLDQMASDRQAFFAELDELLRSADGEARQSLEEVRAAAQWHDEVLDDVLTLRRSGRPRDEVVRAFEDWVRPRRDILDQHLEHLTETEKARLDALDRSTERGASRLAAIATAATGGALLVSLTLALLLGRAFQTLRRRQEELKRAMARVEQANQDLDAFAGRVAHDLRTPLTPITLMTDRLKRSSDEAVVRAAERIERGARAANRMLEELLVFSRLGYRGQSGQTRAAWVIRETLEDLSEKAAEAGVTVHADLDEGAVVGCGEALFRELVGNLAGNAIKFMVGREERRLSLVLRVCGPVSELEVSDTGPGIPPESLGRIFDPFYRVPGVGTPGSGLGLAIVRRVVEAHDGTINVQSTIGRGTTFRVVLPCGQRADQAAQAAATPALAAEARA
jgi:signal transduction histidine kinase